MFVFTFAVTVLGFLPMFLTSVILNPDPELHPEPRTSCIYRGQPMIELVPNSANCSTYYQCTEEAPGKPEPVLKPCSFDAHLFYDFRTCQCEYEDIVTCYDGENPAHREDFFICAKQLEAEISRPVQNRFSD